MAHENLAGPGRTPWRSILEDTDDWLLDSEEKMQAEDALWDAVYARHKAKFLTLREAAQAEIDAGLTYDRRVG